MLYDRSYMRQPAGSDADNNTSMVTTLMVITVALFALQHAFGVFFPGSTGQGTRVIADWLSLSAQEFSNLKVWTVLSYAFLHSSTSYPLFFVPIPFAHLVFNMLGLFFIGREIEKLIGKRQLLYFYLASAILGGLSFLIFNFNNNHTVIGASAAVSALLAFYLLHHAGREVFFLFIPVPVKFKWLLIGIVVISTFGLMAELQNQSSVAHSAHLGGLLAGFLYYRYVYHGNFPFFTASSKKPVVELPEWIQRKKKSPPKIDYKVNLSSRDRLQSEVDRILDKINATGFGSLTKQEQKTLDNAKDLLKK